VDPRIEEEKNMSEPRYDAIVVGARCAGSPTAMLLARKGYKVLMVDRATFPSDTVSTHLIHPPGVEALKRWGLLERVAATGAPPIARYELDLGPIALKGTPGTKEAPASYGPRRTVLDKLLVDAAAESGVEVRESFVVEELTFQDDRVTGIRGREKNGKPITESARVVIGADGLNSLVGRAVGAESYHEKPRLQVSYYSYWSGLPVGDGFQAYDRGDRNWAAWSTNDGLTLLIAGWSIELFETIKQDPERHSLEAFERAPEFAERVRAAKREDRFYGMAVPNFFRKPYGPGWALIGDAGYNKDFITAQGISDAFRDAERCVAALDQSFQGASTFETAMAAYQTARDQHALPIYEFTCDFASFTPPTPAKQALIGAIHGNQPATDGFFRMFAGVDSPADYFSEENVGRIMAAAGGRQPSGV
jgi:2-polyprenyl-6-methoxyphenol hydroxylase-like FAD-dependent oxidoreductase